MGKREYDRVYQRQHTKVIQIRLHKENDADIIDDIISEAKRDGVSVSSRLKHLIRIGYRYYKEDFKCTMNCDCCSIRDVCIYPEAKSKELAKKY